MVPGSPSHSPVLSSHVLGFSSLEGSRPRVGWQLYSSQSGHQVCHQAPRPQGPLGPGRRSGVWASLTAGRYLSRSAPSPLPSGHLSQGHLLCDQPPQRTLTHLTPMSQVRGGQHTGRGMARRGGVPFLHEPGLAGASRRLGEDGVTLARDPGRNRRRWDLRAVPVPVCTSLLAFSFLSSLFSFGSV